MFGNKKLLIIDGPQLDKNFSQAARNLSEVDMVRVAEDFFVSLGFERLADTFWE